jgi:hypothetical protein
MTKQTINDKIEETLNKPMHPDSFVFEAKANLHSLATFILDECEKCIPEKISYTEHMKSKASFDNGNGHDACRAETIAKLSELRKDLWK